jgi:hypothetical protein
MILIRYIPKHPLTPFHLKTLADQKPETNEYGRVALLPYSPIISTSIFQMTISQKNGILNK